MTTVLKSIGSGMRKDGSHVIQVTMSEQDNAGPERVAVVGSGTQIQYDTRARLVFDNDGRSESSPVGP